MARPACSWERRSPASAQAHNITIDPWKIWLGAKATLAILHIEYRETTCPPQHHSTELM